MLHLQIDSRGSAPAYRQLMDQVKYYVASGSLRPGDQLPSIRDAARYLAVNPSTVVKAWTELEHEGVVERQHGKGVFISDKARRVPARELEAALRRGARRLAVEAVQMGASPEEVLAVLREELLKMTESES